MKLKKLISEIEKQTNYLFVYNAKDVNTDQEVKVDAGNRNLFEVLDASFQNSNLSYTVSNNYITLISKKNVAEVTSLPAGQQQTRRKITGVVTDESGPVAGASVTVTGTTNGAMTDNEGRFELNILLSDATLTISFLGYTTRVVPITQVSHYAISLNEDSKMLEEVVVTALGISREKKALTYSVQEVKSGAIIENRSSSVVNALSGKVAGMNISKTSTPGGSTRILVRGTNSLMGNNMPLIVVDGIPYDNKQGTSGDVSWGGTDYGDGISNLNQDDIESISVLKGPSATALYGSRAGNGVLLITTKKGTLDGGPRVSLTSNFTVEKLMIQPKYQNVYGQGTLGEFQNNLRSSWGPKMEGQILKANNATWAGILSNDPVLLLDWTGQSRPFSYSDNDMYHLLKTGYTWNNNVDLNLSSGKSSIRASLSDSRSTGVIPGNKFVKTGTTIRATGDVLKNLTYDTKISYTRQVGTNRPTLAVNGYNPMFGYQYVPRSINLADFHPVIDPSTGNSRMFESGTPTLVLNPYIATEMKGNEDVTDRITGFASLKYQFTDWLSLMGRLGIDTYQYGVEEWYAKGSNISIATSINGRYMENMTRFLEINGDFLLSAKKDNLFSSKFSGNISFGGNIMDRRSNYLISDAQGLNIDGLYTIANGITKATNNSKSKKQIQSFYGFAQLSYDNWAYLDLTARNDWSSTLPRGNWSFFYPSAGLGVIVTELLDRVDVKAPKWLSFAKLRASVAEAGNDTDPYNLYPVYSTLQNLPGGQNGVVLPYSLPNANLKPEIIKSYELGAEIRLLNNRIGLDFTYYQKQAKNQIFRVATSMTSGYSSKIINAGRIDNKGIEAILNASIIRNKDWNWDMTFNFAKNKSKVVELDGVQSEYLMQTPGATQLDIKAIVGRPVGEMYSTSQLRNEDGKLLLSDTGEGTNAYYGSPTVSSTRDTYVGNMNPDWTGGISSTLSYKGFYINFLIDIRAGGKLYLNSMVRLNGNGATEETLAGRDTWYPFFEEYIKDQGYNPYATATASRYKDLYDAATAAHAGVYVDGVKASDGVTPMAGYINPQYFFGRYGQDHYIYSMTNIRLREVTFGYLFPAKWFKRTPIKSLKLSFVGNNLFFIYNKLPGFDPESTYSSGNVQGVETASFPSTRSLGFNLNVSF
ncbi:SusC/RagA family TonB-linked outer membrane protein [Bacteroidia bacterium]|nr:SusC/RagA family TonB-linked outer membrane protein [Bacteroidia bacterium]GHV38781.1 SusC/RagA family TonB-linked outer membrane protein [Bacteroidia bacterium]